jgi:hypothetical protein
LLVTKFIFAGALPIAAWAAGHTVPSPETIHAIGVGMWFWIVTFSLLGWAMADLDKVAEVWNPAIEGRFYEKMKECLKLYKGILASVGAGIATFVVTDLAPGPVMTAFGLRMADGSVPRIPAMAALLLVAGAGYMGSRWWARFETKIPGG